MRQGIATDIFSSKGNTLKRTKGWIRLRMFTPPRLDMHILFPHKGVRNQAGEWDNTRDREVRKMAVDIKNDIISILEKYGIKLLYEEEDKNREEINEV